jgi:hypothetical protein
MDHDQRFKTLIATFFPEFLELFFPPWAKRLDARSVEWLDKEVFPDPPEGPRRLLDLVGRVPTRAAVPGQRPGERDSWLALVHIEIESPDKATPLRARMADAYDHLRAKYRLPVLPIALYLQVALHGVGTDEYVEYFWELEVRRFRYLYAGMPGLDAVAFVQGNNWLGVALAALMRMPRERVAWVGAEALRRLLEAPLTEQQRFLLAECVQAYLPLDEAQQREYEELIATPPYQGVKAMNATWFEKGIEKGIDKERRESLRELLEAKFGPLAPGVAEKIQQLPTDRLRALQKALLTAASLRELGLED